MNAIDSFHETVKKSLVKFGCILPQKKVNSYGYVSWDFSLSMHGNNWDFQITFINADLTTLPSVRWVKPYKIWGWPHINADGIICYEDGQGLEYNPEDIMGVIIWVLQESTGLIKKYWNLGRSRRKSEFFDELDGYLKSLNFPQVLQIDSFGNASNEFAYAEVKYPKTNKWRGEVLRIHTNLKEANSNGYTYEKLFVIKVNKNKIPPITSKIDYIWWKQLLFNLNVTQESIINDTRCNGAILRISNIYGHCEILIYWSSAQGYIKNLHLKLYRIQSANKDYITKRTGIPSNEKKIAIFGIGSVGSRIAEMATLSGCKEIHLIDYDLFSADNLGRHILGFDSIGKFKTQEIKKQLINRVPGSTVYTYDMSAQQFFVKNSNEFDIVFLATGNSSLEKILVKKFFKEQLTATVVVVSVEAYDLGGQIIIMDTKSKGCLNCLYFDNETNLIGPYLQGSLIIAGQKTSKQLTGCGAFTPFSGINATKTAMIAFENAVLNKFGYFRWVGSDDLAKNEGIELSSAYYRLCQQKIPSYLRPEQFVKENCTCCG
ncbi:ThiF family adenylyltransferase [Pantoea agglomerans]|uniref:ThiF family adenylyltransferase n=1 Tax=Enterobacter agglomerans TaxID=549 RepID=UPI00165472E1|nr:ThiF family adenylyltransferase [Pantoea agglomerans]